jgi:hypothetical protein
MTVYIKPTRHLSGAIVERLQQDFGMSLERYISMYKETPASREIMKELSDIFFRLPVGEQIFKVTTAMPETELLPLIMSILVCPFFWDAHLEAIFKDRILSRRSKPVKMKQMVVEANAKYPDMSWHTYADLFRFLIVRLPIYTTAKLPGRITSEELPDFLDAIGVGALTQRYNLEELFLAFTLIGYPLYLSTVGEGWNVGLQVIGARTLAHVLTKRKVGNAEVDHQGNFDSVEV